MSQKLVSHNDDLRHLRERGYALTVSNGFVIVRDIPYLDERGDAQVGALVGTYDDIDGLRIRPADHQFFFAGGVPHQLDGSPIANLGGGAHSLVVGAGNEDLMVQRSFSFKPRTNGALRAYRDHEEKVESYVDVIAGPAMERHGRSPLTFRVPAEADSGSVFLFQDTLSSRAQIVDLSARFSHDVVAVIGAGGTGSFVIDFLAKTPVREIRVFDADVYHVNNAFRSPGRLADTELGRAKADVMVERYATFRRGMTAYRTSVDAGLTTELEGVTFAFVCVDSGPSRAGVFDALMARKIPFIDVGMEPKRKGGSLRGMVRTTYFAPDVAALRHAQGLADLHGGPDDLYRTNVQIAELNALNACIAVIRFKQLRGFYATDESAYQVLFDITDLRTVSLVDDEVMDGRDGEDSDSGGGASVASDGASPAP